MTNVMHDSLAVASLRASADHAPACRSCTHVVTICGPTWYSTAKEPSLRTVYQRSAQELDRTTRFEPRRCGRVRNLQMHLEVCQLRRGIGPDFAWRFLDHPIFLKLSARHNNQRACGRQNWVQMRWKFLNDTY